MPKLNMRNTLFVLIFFSFLPFASGQKYKLYSTDDGLSKSNVTQIIKDSRGFMWFGTLVGLNRFDGYKFITYYHDINDSTSISNNNIRKIIEDENGDFWIATTYGLNKYIFNDDLFLRYYQTERSNSLSDNFINSIYLDKQNNLWVATARGLDKYDKATDTFTRFSCLLERDGVSNSVAVFDITQDNRGVFWLCTEVDGLVSFVEETQQFYLYSDTLHPSPSGNLINDKYFIETTDDVLKIDAVNGFFEFDLKTKRFTPSTPTNTLLALNDSILIGTSNSYTDDTGMEWYSVSNKGIISLDPSRNKFTSFSNANTQSGLIGEKVSAIAEDANGIIWLGTNNGICSFDPVNQRFTNRTNSNVDIYNISSGITSLCFDSNGQLWVGTGVGLYRYNFSSKSLQHFSYVSGNPNSVLSNNIYCIYQDSQKNIWVGAGGLNLYDSSTGSFIQFKPESNSNNSVNTKYIVSIYEDETGKLWMGTWAGGINIFDPVSRTFSYMMVDSEANGPLKTNDVGSIYKDSKGFLWFTSTGVTKYNPLNKQFQWYSTIDGLPNNAISDILEDNNGMMWISTGHGMAVLDPETMDVRVFDRLDGLQGNEFTYNAAIKSTDGKLYFGGTNGFSIIDPDNMIINEFKPEVVLTDFQIFNESVKIGEEIDGHLILEKNIAVTKEITLRHYESVFSIEFAALHYTIPDKNKYAYMLEGLETDWNYTNAQRRYATYTTLNPGKYVFKVKASNSDGIWNEEGYSLNIVILPPWWQTAWFRLLMVITLFALILAFYYIQLHSIKNRNKKLDRLVKIKTTDLEEVNKQLNIQKNHLLGLNESLKKYQEEILTQKEEISQQNRTLKAKNYEIMNMSQRLHDQDQMKLQYFTNVSHEFRTPLTLILSPLDKLIGSQSLNTKQSEQLSMIETNAKRLLNLVNQLLDIGKMESGTMKAKKISGNFIEFIQTIFKVFQEQSEKRNIQFYLETDLIELHILFDFDKLEKIIYNLLSNSFKFTPDGGKISLGVSLERDKVVVSVADTGIGIAKNEITKIFDPFYQVDASNTRFHEGSGIGLYHTRELIDIIGGNIQIDSEPGIGTTVKIYFLLESHSHLTSEIQPNDMLGNKQLVQSTLSDEVISDKKLAVDVKPIILIVEDNIQLRAYIKDELGIRYKIIEAPNGRVGLEMAHRNFPDLIISDIMMPEMDGLELCRTLKDDELISHIPVILLTARVEESDAIAGIETGADDYIPKPFNIKLLEAKVEQLLTTRRKLREKFSKEIFSEPSNIAFTNADQVFLQKLIKLIEDNISNEDFLVNDIAQEIGMGKTNLYKKVLALTDQSVADFVRSIKLKKAALLLISNEYSVSEVAYQVGFKDASHFIKSFTRQYKFTPKKFIEQQKLKKDAIGPITD
jgi:signal transduction histidine kinase/ligand-binding sensor domain-containing protein/DNA-binding response OmpR family regulator